MVIEQVSITSHYRLGTGLASKRYKVVVGWIAQNRWRIGWIVEQDPGISND